MEGLKKKNKDREGGAHGAKCDGKAQVRSMQADTCEGSLESMMKPNS